MAQQGQPRGALDQQIRCELGWVGLGGVGAGGFGCFGESRFRWVECGFRCSGKGVSVKSPTSVNPLHSKLKRCHNRNEI